MHKSYQNNNERIKEERVAYILELCASGRERGGQSCGNREAVKPCDNKARPAKPLEQGKNIFIFDATFCNVVHLYSKRNR